jgi:signal transduction histidine kinase
LRECKTVKFNPYTLAIKNEKISWTIQSQDNLVIFTGKKQSLEQSNLEKGFSYSNLFLFEVNHEGLVTYNSPTANQLFSIPTFYALKQQKTDLQSNLLSLCDTTSRASLKKWITRGCRVNLTVSLNYLGHYTPATILIVPQTSGSKIIIVQIEPRSLSSWKENTQEHFDSEVQYNDWNHSSIYREIIEKTDIAFWRLHIPSGKLYWGPGMNSLYEIPLENLKGEYSDWANALTPESLIHASEALQKSIATRTNFNESFDIVTASGTKRIGAKGILKFNSNGEPEEVLGLNWDASSQERLENRLSQLSGQLENSSRLATLGEYSGGLMHDLGNLLTITEGFSTMALRALNRGDNDKANDALERQLGSTKTMKELFAATMSSLRGSAQKPELLTPSEFMTGILPLIKTRLNSYDISLDVDASEDAVLFTRSEISQVVLNLIKNSMDAIEEKRSLNHRTESQEPSDKEWIRLSINSVNSVLKIQVTDSGPGIPEAIQKRIMEPFFTTKKNGKGTGLGLSIIKRLAENNGGRFFLDTHAKNTTFIFEKAYTGTSEQKTNTIKEEETPSTIVDLSIAV